MSEVVLKSAYDFLKSENEALKAERDGLKVSLEDANRCNTVLIETLKERDADLTRHKELLRDQCNRSQDLQDVKSMNAETIARFLVENKDLKSKLEKSVEALNKAKQWLARKNTHGSRMQVINIKHALKDIAGANDASKV